MTPEQMTDEQLIAPKTITSCVEVEDGIWDVVLSCGHEAVFVIQPFLTEMGCAQCLDIYINRSKDARRGARD
jgi:hypothetical protein